MWPRLDGDLEVDAHVMITDHDLFDDQTQHLLLLLKGKIVEALPDLL
jgi:hypothetical protein